MGDSVNGSVTGTDPGTLLGGPHYKWLALSNTTLGMLAATVNASMAMTVLVIAAGASLLRGRRYVHDEHGAAPVTQDTAVGAALTEHHPRS